MADVGSVAARQVCPSLLTPARIHVRERVREAAGRVPGRASRGAFGGAEMNDNQGIRVRRECVLVFRLVRPRAFGAVRSRGSVEERPVHTGEVAGSIPAGTTPKSPVRNPDGAFLHFRSPRSCGRAGVPGDQRMSYVTATFTLSSCEPGWIGTASASAMSGVRM